MMVLMKRPHVYYSDGHWYETVPESEGWERPYVYERSRPVRGSVEHLRPVPDGAAVAWYEAVKRAHVLEIEGEV